MSPNEKFSEFLKLLQKELNITQRELAEILGNRDSTISRWEKAEVEPQNIDLKFIMELASLKGWSIAYLINYLYEIPLETKSVEDLKVLIAELSIIEKLKLLSFLSDDIQSVVAFKTTKEFRLIVIFFLESNQFDYVEAARVTGIMPPQRFLGLTNGVAPEKIDLIKLSTCDRFRKPNGDRYSFVELMQIVYGN